MRLFGLFALSLLGVLRTDAATELSCSGYSCLELRDDGTVYAIGYNNNGQLGQGDLNHETSPKEVLLPASAVKVKLKNSGSYALLTDGSLWGWGYNGYGRIGTGDTAPVHSPFEIDAGPVSEIFVGGQSVLYRVSNGSTYFLGYNPENTIMTGDENIVTPTHFAEMDNFDNIYEDLRVLCGVHKVDGMLYCRGNNDGGLINESSDNPVTSMTPMFGGVQVQSFYMTNRAVCALDMAGNARCSGWNQMEDWCEPESVTGILLSNVIDMDIFGNAAMVTADGKVYMCGDSSAGQFGYGRYDKRWRLTEVPSVTNAVSVHIVYKVIFARTANGGLWTWGNDGHDSGGQSGYDPVLLYPTGVLDVEPMGLFNARIGIGGESFWRTAGDATYGLRYRAGTEDTFEPSTMEYTASPTNSPTTGSPTAPTPPTVTPTASPTTSPTVKADTQYFRCGHKVCLELRSDGSVYSAGNGVFGELGINKLGLDGPVQVPLRTSAVWVDIKGLSSYALLSDGSLWGWGRNNYGQLGTGKYGLEVVPFMITSGPVSEVHVQNDHLHYIDDLGDYYAVGSNGNKLLIDDAETKIPEPVPVSYLSNYRDIRVHDVNLCGIHKTSGELHCRGSNSNNQIDGTSGHPVASMTPAFGGAVVKQFSVYNGIICAILDSDELHCKYFGSSHGCYAGDGVTLMGSDVVDFDLSDNNLAFVNTAGEAWVCGEDNYGQHGAGKDATDESLSQVPGVTDATSVISQYDTYYAITSTGSMWAWGLNYFGQTGGGNSTVNIPAYKALAGGVLELRKGTSKIMFFGLENESQWFFVGLDDIASQIADTSYTTLRATPFDYVSGLPTPAPTDSPTVSPTRSPTITGFCYSTADCEGETEMCDVNNACIPKPACVEHVDCVPHMLSGRAAYCESDVCHDRYVGNCTTNLACETRKTYATRFEKGMGAGTLKYKNTNATLVAHVIALAIAETDGLYGSDDRVLTLVQGNESVVVPVDIYTDHSEFMDALIAARCGDASDLCTARLVSTNDDGSRRLSGRDLATESVTIEIVYEIDDAAFAEIQGDSLDSESLRNKLATQLGVAPEDIDVFTETTGEVTVAVVLTEESDGFEPIGEDALADIQNIQSSLATITSDLVTELGLEAADIEGTEVDLCAGRDCSGRGTCDPATGVCACDVDTHWGINCETPVSCLNGGTVMGAYCACDYPAYGQRCGLTRDCACA